MLITDVAVFAGAPVLLKGANVALRGALERSSAAQTIAAGGSFGLLSGSLNEVQRQNQQDSLVIRYGHRPFEQTAYEFHQLTDFTCAIPQTVHRDVTNWGPNPHLSADGIDVQQRIGKSLADRVEGARKLVIDPQLRDQLEQATAERLIMGDRDGYPRNMTVSRKDGKWLVANIDFAPKGNADLRTFSKSSLPPDARSYLSGQSISQPTLDKIRNLIERLDNPGGKESLRKIGLSEEQSDALIMRAPSFRI
jgi:hypothetical protein